MVDIGWRSDGVRFQTELQTPRRASGFWISKYPTCQLGDTMREQKLKWVLSHVWGIKPRFRILYEQLILYWVDNENVMEDKRSSSITFSVQRVTFLRHFRRTLSAVSWHSRHRPSFPSTSEWTDIICALFIAKLVLVTSLSYQIKKCR